MRYIVGGQAELTAADTVALHETVSKQEGRPTITLERVRLVQEYLIDAMREIGIDQASIAGVTCLDAEAKQAK